jgi:hypothetical protein
LALREIISAGSGNMRVLIGDADASSSGDPETFIAWSASRGGYAPTALGFDEPRLRRIPNPMAPKPRIIIIQVAGSGTAEPRSVADTEKEPGLSA